MRDRDNDRKTVFFKTRNGPIKADLFIVGQPKDLQVQLNEAADRLSRTGSIDGSRAAQLEDGRWSIWLEDQLGERYHFELYVSIFEQTDSVPLRSACQSRRLGVFIGHGHAQGEWHEFVDASDFIYKNFSGKIRSQLLSALEKALSGVASFDGSVELTAEGVVIRALSDNQQVKKFVAEVFLSWEVK